MPGDNEHDVPSPLNLRDTRDAIAWTDTAEVKRPWRRELRESISEILRDRLRPQLTLFDFSPPFLEMCRKRLGENAAHRFVLGDFTRPDWPTTLDQPFDAVVSMQAAHEIRHKRHLVSLHAHV